MAIDGFRPLTDTELAQLAPEELEVYEEELEALYWEAGKKSLLDFSARVELPGAPVGEEEDGVYFPLKVKTAAHHRLIIDAIQGFADGRDDDIDGVMIFCPPGSAKSSFASVLAPAWLLGRKPGTNVIATSYGDDLAQKFGRRVRSIARSKAFEKIMGCGMTGDNQDVKDWSLTNGSEYRASGLGGTITGIRADFLFIDDPVKNREEADSETMREKRWEAYNDDVQSRLKPDGKICIIMTRWSEDDLCGRLLSETWKGQSGLWRTTDGRLYKVINLPLLAEHKDDPLGRKPGELLWADWFRMKDAIRMQNNAKKGGSFARTWSSLYQQRPKQNEGAILLRSYWQPWAVKKKNPDGRYIEDEETGEPKLFPKELPECDYIYLCYDTAFEEEEVNDPSAMTAWGVFKHTSKKLTGEEYNHDHIILLGAWEERVPSPDLGGIIKAHVKLFRPTRVIVEKRASGHTVIKELRRAGIPVKAWLPPGIRGAKGKIPRAHAAAYILEQGSVHYVPGVKTEKVLDQCAALGGGAAHDDLADTVTCMLIYFRDKFIFQTADDELDLEEMKERLAEKAAMKRSSGRRLYGGERSSGLEIDPVEPDEVERMTEATKRRLYG